MLNKISSEVSLHIIIEGTGQNLNMNYVETSGIIISQVNVG